MPTATKSKRPAPPDLAQQVQDLARRLAKVEQQGARSVKWWIDHAGRFANDPVFDEIVRLGKKVRGGVGNKPRGARARR